MKQADKFVRACMGQAVAPAVLFSAALQAGPSTAAAATATAVIPPCCFVLPHVNTGLTGYTGKRANLISCVISGILYNMYMLAPVCGSAESADKSADYSKSADMI